MGIAAAVLSVLSCKQEQTVDYLSLGVTSYTFSNTVDSVKFKVESSSDWEVSNDNEWVKYRKIGTDSLVVAVADNSEGEQRNGRITVISGQLSAEMSLSQFGMTYNGSFVDFSDCWSTAISKNGRYVGTMKKDDRDPKKVYPILIDTYTGEKKEFQDILDFLNVYAVGNDGVLYLNTSNQIETKILQLDGTVQDIRLPEGYGYPNVQDLSSDGTIWVGYCRNISTNKFEPVRWTNGEAEILEAPEVCLYGTPSTSGTMARGCSDDGSVIYGSEWSWMQHPVVYWKNGEMSYPGYEFSENDGETYYAMTLDAERTNISPNGRYITSNYSGTLAVVDTDMGIQILLDASVTGLSSTTGITATDNGLIFGATPAMGVTSGYVFNLNDDSAIPIDQWFMDNYGVHMSGDRMVTRVSSDGNVYFGYRPHNAGMGTTYKYWYFVVDRNKLPQE